MTEEGDRNGRLDELVESLAKPDPTKNVIAILEAAVQRQDDLRESEHVALRREAEIRAEYEDKLREAESKRIDAIRAVDVGAVNRAAEVAAIQAQTLAAQVAVSADTLRAQVAAAASAATIALAAALEPVQKDIADLRRAQYEAQGVKAQNVEGRSSNQWLVGVLGGGILAIVGIGVSIAVALSASGP